MNYETIEYPYIFHRIAKDISKDRTAGMHKNYKDKDYYVGDKTKLYNVQGVLTELIAWDYFTIKEIKFEALSMFGTEPEVEADLIAEGRKIDVKYIPPYAKYLMVNYNSHNNIYKDVTEYMFIQPIERIEFGKATARIWFVKHNEVDIWNVDKHNTKVYCKKL
jgi:hypothetical protein